MLGHGHAITIASKVCGWQFKKMYPRLPLNTIQIMKITNKKKSCTNMYENLTFS